MLKKIPRLMPGPLEATARTKLVAVMAYPRPGKMVKVEVTLRGTPLTVNKVLMGRRDMLS